jgi:hypothetical protein
VLIVEAPPDAAASLAGDPAVSGVFEGAVPSALTQDLDETGKLGVAAWNERHSDAYAHAKKGRVGEGLSWDHPDFEKEGVR